MDGQANVISGQHSLFYSALKLQDTSQSSIWVEADIPSLHAVRRIFIPLNFRIFHWLLTSKVGLCFWWDRSSSKDQIYQRDEYRCSQSLYVGSSLSSPTTKIFSRTTKSWEAWMGTCHDAWTILFIWYAWIKKLHSLRETIFGRKKNCLWKPMLNFFFFLIKKGLYFVLCYIFWVFLYLFLLLLFIKFLSTLLFPSSLAAIPV